MNRFNCPRCGYSNTRKVKLENHFNRKKPCENTISNIEISKYKDALLLDKGGVVLSIIKEKERLEKMVINPIDDTTTNNNINPMGDNNTNNNNNNNNTTTTTNNNNITNNIDIKIILNSVDEPNLDYITTKDADLCLKDLQTAMLEMAKKIFFNTKHPENMSIYKTSCKNSLIKYFKEGGWNVGEQNIVVKMMTESINDGLELADDSEKYYTLTDKYINNKKFKKNVDKSLVTECYNNKKLGYNK